MSKINWRNAPEWANAVIKSKDDQAFYVSQFGGISARQRIGYSQVDNDASADMIHPHDWTLVETRHPAWSGKGLPPAGTVCDHRTGNGMSWSQATILAHGEKKVFYRDRDGHEWTLLYDEIEFRPVRTPEQIIADREREERIKSAQAWLQGIAQEYGKDAADKCEDILMEFENRKQEAK
jgi:hypothetical protein